MCDYLRFILIDGSLDTANNAGQYKAEVRICELNELKNYKKLNLESKFEELKVFFHLFYTQQPKPINTGLEFADALAIRTKMLKELLESMQENEQIKSLYEVFQNNLYNNLEFSIFCDSFAQTLTYALFLAKLNNDNMQKIDLYNVEKFIPKSFPLIRAMSGFLKVIENLPNSNLKNMQWLISEILDIINHIEVPTIIKEFNKLQDKDVLGNYLIIKDPYLHFYETFLSKYDPHLRELRGVYYTPQSVVRFIIDSIDLILQSDFSKVKGLGSAIDNKDIRLLDFATGTGTFLLESFRKSLSHFKANSTNYEPKKLLENFLGFELLIAPYTIAHLKISQSFKEEFQAELNDGERLKIYLTNTLFYKDTRQFQNEQNLLFGMYELAKEAKSAQETKESKILIITGNPPYSGASSNKGLYENEVRIRYGLEPQLSHLSPQESSEIKAFITESYKEPIHRNIYFNRLKSTFKSIFERKKLQNEKNPKWLLDDYVKFICFAESKIKENESGIFAFISNNSFLDNPTFRGMRYHLLNTFDKIYILDLHGNARKKEKAKDGSKDENVFDIMQGVSINIFVKLPNITESKSLAKLYHYDLYGTRKYKYEFLHDKNLDSIKWQNLKPQVPFYLFIPQDYKLKKEYDKGWSVKDIFSVSGVGITTAHDSFVIDSNKETLLQKFKDFRDSAPDSNRLHEKFNVAKKEGWDILKGWQNLQGENNLEKYIQKIHYRPFDVRYIFYEDKLVWRCVRDIMCNFIDFNNIGLIYKRGFPNSESGHGFTTNSINDFRSWSCSGMQGGDYVSPLYIKTDSNPKNIESKKGKKDSKNTKSKDSKDSQKWQENFTPKFRAFIDSKYDTHFSPEQILGYIYAVLFHKDYREKYLEFLKTDFPKIPFVESKEKFLALSALGLELIATHIDTGGGGGNPMNIALVCCRQTKASSTFQHAFIATMIMEMCYISNRTTEVNYIFPLYLKI